MEKGWSRGSPCQLVLPLLVVMEVVKVLVVAYMEKKAANSQAVFT